MMIEGGMTIIDMTIVNSMMTEGIDQSIMKIESCPLQNANI